MPLTEHAILKGKGASGHPKSTWLRSTQPTQWSTVFLLDLLHNAYSTHLAMNHLFLGPLCLSRLC